SDSAAEPESTAIRKQMLPQVQRTRLPTISLRDAIECNHRADINRSAFTPWWNQLDTHHDLRGRNAVARHGGCATQRRRDRPDLLLCECQDGKRRRLRGTRRKQTHSVCVDAPVSLCPTRARGRAGERGREDQALYAVLIGAKAKASPPERG